MNINAILQGELNPYASESEKEERSKHIVHRIGTTDSTAVVNQMIDNQVKGTAGVHEWGDNSYTVFDIRPR